MTSIVHTDVGELRKWIRQRQTSHRERGATAGNIYFVVLFIAIVGGMLHKQLAVVFWPTHPNASELAGLALALSGVGGIFLSMRRLGPLGLSRPAASWLLTAPVSRRKLLLPSLRLASILAAIVGALFGVAVVGHVAVRPLPGWFAVALLAGCALGGILMLLAALAAQASHGWARWADRLAGLVLAAGLAGFVTDSAIHVRRPTGEWPANTVGLAVLALAVVVLGLLTIAVLRLARTPNTEILESAQTAGTLLDSAFGVEPSFVADMMERRYWSRRRLRSKRLWGRIPVLVAQDLLLAWRRPRRLLWTIGSVALPAMLAHGPHWVLAVVVLLGGMVAGGASTSNVRTDAANPVLLRMLGLDSRAAVAQRLLLPATIASIWYAAAFGLLMAFGDLPAGPWWVLGLALGPVGGIAAVRRARVGMVRNDMLAMDTQMGVSISPGPLLKAVIGPDALLLGAVALIQIAGGHPLSWTTVLIQALVGGLCARGYVSATTARDRLDL